jgi:beta-xylosidase
MSAPVYRDPIEDGAADPTVIRREGTDEWWMFYTNRRANAGGDGFSWIHGSPIGVAVSRDDGISWTYKGTVKGLDAPGDDGLNTHWAPEVIFAEGRYHMFLSYIKGVPTHWKVPRTITHFVSDDLENWERVGPLKLSSSNCIDACVFRSPEGIWRMWYKDEGQGSSTWSATSPDMMAWTLEGQVLPGSPEGPPHEGPNVFALGGFYWLITDEWRGQAVYRSDDTLTWKRQGTIAGEPGVDPLDQKFARHADVVVTGENAVMYYFTHAEWDETKNPSAGPPDARSRATAVHQARLWVEDGVLRCDRNIAIGQPVLAGG